MTSCVDGKNYAYRGMADCLEADELSFFALLCGATYITVRAWGIIRALGQSCEYCKTQSMQTMQNLTAFSTETRDFRHHWTCGG